MTAWSNDEPTATQRRKLVERARAWTDEERVALTGMFYEELVTHYPLLRPHFERIDLRTLARKLANALKRLLDLDDDRQMLGVEVLRLGAAHANRRLGPAEYRMFVTTLAHVLAQFQSEVPYQHARQIWQADLAAVVELMLVVDGDRDPATA